MRSDKKNQVGAPSVMPQIAEEIAKLQNDPAVTKFDVRVNKKTGVVLYSASNSEGLQVTKNYIGPGLQSIVRYDPSMVSTNDRDQNILTLLDSGLTQQDAARQLGVSQSLVSKVKRTLK